MNQFFPQIYIKNRYFHQAFIFGSAGILWGPFWIDRRSPQTLHQNPLPCCNSLFCGRLGKYQIQLCHLSQWLTQCPIVMLSSKWWNRAILFLPNHKVYWTILSTSKTSISPNYRGLPSSGLKPEISESDLVQDNCLNQYYDIS